MSNSLEGKRGEMSMEIQLTPYIKELALGQEKLTEDEVREIEFGKNDGKMFVSLKKELLVEPQTVEDTEKTVYVSLWKK